MFEEALAESEFDKFMVVRVGKLYVLKRACDVRPDHESPIFGGDYRSCRKLWSRLVRFAPSE